MPGLLDRIETKNVFLSHGIVENDDHIRIGRGPFSFHQQKLVYKEELSI